MRILPLLLAASVLGCAAPAAAREVVTVGVLAFLGAERSVAAWSDTRTALERAIPETDFQLIPLDLPEMRRAVANGDVDFVITNPGNYVELEAAQGVSRIATFEGGEPVASTIFTRADGPVRSLEDLRGARVMAVAPRAFGGFQIAWRELAEHGIDPGADLRLSFSGFPMDKVVAAVRAGQADAGIVRGCLLEHMAANGEIRLEEFRVLHEMPHSGLDCRVSSRLYPDWPFAKLAGTPPELAKRVAVALLAMPATPGWTVPLDYQPVHELFRALRIGPYERLGEVPLAELFWRHWHWLLIVALAAGWWVIHVWRVEHLVKLRTTELEREIAERQRIEEREREQRRELDHVARLSILGEMAGNLAHELNQPLAAITNYADGCALRLQAGRSDEAELLATTQRIAEQAKRAGRVIQRIRALVRKRDAVRLPFDLGDAAREAADLFEGQARRAGVAMTLDLADRLPPVEGDRIQVQQVVLNLLQNAFDAMAATPPAARRLTIATARDGATVRLSVADRGGGLSAEARERLFEPYFTTKPEGIGLGLALSRSIIEAHGGRLWAEDNPAGGVVMHVALPLAENADEQ